ncbi:bis(5'-adenosyl)-triphosphatase enpp4-like [Mizuhopecten yessoensis]|uniref:Bis(5'-adenosyl)-triphosphatase enpp4 n=1 Tax=Mizuhopecten yessoensis TaxID=6573 RepID=A0A210QJI2_MIZYE|nr:bis(5'-adenosyl)-triphosphatase enpp4-like [Mizuhopecten yessoensis]XP_021356748.1 bis(5'-adenosyl)-triphosphatase enpp4-like [Mizuhopecten yessoensis]XP_021356749.1 bis(5'-adenosyl)-triphosphatase enpp4-like [Mizuhopecten yessoensis]OWF48846.1 Bis(5'-adenosyl)-triphosphatase enpp4 [Mizuhopecten yessoensis]
MAKTSHCMSVLILLMVCITGETADTCRKYANQVLLVSMDGFRYDYPEKAATPNFDKMAQNGVRAEYMTSTFTTKTFPAHYSIATGLYDESHGIVGNNMYDPEFGEFFTMRSRETKWWDGGEPLWITARRQGLSSGTMFWPGSEVEIQGIHANKWYNYNESITFDQRIDIVIDMLKNDKYNFVTTYFHEPDRTGHRYGPDSQEVVDKITEMDELLGTILDKLIKNGLQDKVNFILTSDHGMAEVDYDNKLVEIYDLVNKSLVNITVGSGPIMHVIPENGEEDAIINDINSHPNFTAYRKADIPDRWHYKNNRRVMPIFVVADEGWTITWNATRSKLYPSKGNHGYDNGLMSMKPIFYAMGPNFRSNLLAPPLNSVDVYPLVCELLGITPSPNNGTLANIITILQPFSGDSLVCDGANSVTSGRVNVQLVFVFLLARFMI